MDCSLPGSSVHSILQARTLKWAASSFSKGIFLTRGSNLHPLHWLYHRATREAPTERRADCQMQEVLTLVLQSNETNQQTTHTHEERKVTASPMPRTSVQFSSVAQSCPTLCNSMNRSTPGLPVHHQLPEFTQTYVHRVGVAIQPSHPLSSPSPPAPSPSQHQGLFQ